jgi:hypothetical protein
MNLEGFEPATPASYRPQALALDLSATEIEFEPVIPQSEGSQNYYLERPPGLAEVILWEIND